MCFQRDREGDHETGEEPPAAYAGVRPAGRRGEQEEAGRKILRVHIRGGQEQGERQDPAQGEQRQDGLPRGQEAQLERRPLLGVQRHRQNGPPQRINHPPHTNQHP